ncbi:unnamed protein product [Adineta steineri]|uniref:SAM domain-containing protein n=1 Tax=Adineta steineri TaxID=433720 RepID=A0A814BLC2_9BILA|nr:unnamed protein product [Adineta steineri]CAF1075303.1 unnamed protein product [Adineta steineri]CAF3564533.1 unnamed protein product [Adineta steineri]CAF3674324.1 unnamed protein product [Adineta steineri]
MEQFISLTVICLTILVYYSYPSQQNNIIAYNIPDPECTGVFNLCTDADKERLGRQAIGAIHEQMDDDKDGLIESSESADFIKEELESKTDAIRYKQFQNVNIHITLDDLWTQWQNNPVYNWTTDNVVDWLVNYAHLPQYVENFRRNQFDGRMIPRLAANEKMYISSIMHIRDVRDKRRLIIKATDVVLFGPPQPTHNLLKDMILISALFVSIGGCIYAFLRQRQTQENMNIVLKELETLQQAEGNLLAVTEKMRIRDSASKENKSQTNQNLFRKWLLEVEQTKEEADRFRKRRDSAIDHEKQLSLALQEIEQLQLALRKAEEHAQHQSYEPPNELIELLRRTYHNEEAAFEVKRKLAETALITAKEQMNKISKMQKGFFGAVRIAHTNCIDNVGELINAAKDRLIVIHDEYEEREQRWNRIATLLNRDDLNSFGSSTPTPVVYRGKDSPRLRT